MFLRANARQGGLEDRGQPRQATYAAAMGPSGVVALAAHCWNGILLVQAPEQIPEVARAALAASGRPLKGISGPADQVRTARDALGVRQAAKSGIEVLQAQGDHWLLEDGGEPVSYTAFNARLPDIVQVGGVWTPLPLRGRGYARCAVAGSLLEARAAGARRAILFTNSTPGARAYEALGFTRAGEYGLLIL